MARERRFTRISLTGKLTREGKHSGFTATKADAAALKRLTQLVHSAEAESPARAWLKVDEVAEAIGLSPKTIRRAITSGELRASKVRKRVRIRSVDVEAWLQDNPATIRPVPEYEWP